MTEKQWYAVHTYSGHENKVKTNIERRAESMNLKDKVFRILGSDGDGAADTRRQETGSAAQGLPGLCAHRDGFGRHNVVPGQEHDRRHGVCVVRAISLCRFAGKGSPGDS